MEILQFLRDTYWSTDYLVEKNGSIKLAKFVSNNLIEKTSSIVLLTKSLKNVPNILIPEEFFFYGERESIFIYDIKDYNGITQHNDYGMDSTKLSFGILKILKNLLHLPKSIFPMVGIDDFIVLNGEIFMFLPIVDRYDELFKIMHSRGAINKSVFFPPEYPASQNNSVQGLIYVFGKALLQIIQGKHVDERVSEILLKMVAEEPQLRTFDENLLLSYRSLSDKCNILLGKIERDELHQISDFINIKEHVFLGIVGPQRIGKTTLLNDVKSMLKERTKHFIQATDVSDFIVQFLQIYSEIIDEELVKNLMACLENNCKVDVLLLYLIEAFSQINEDFFVIVDDYQERNDEFKAFLEKLYSVCVNSNLNNPVKVFAFSTDDYKEFVQRIYLSPFDKEKILTLVKNSIGKVRNLEALVEWLKIVSHGLVGVLIESLRFLVDSGALYKDGDSYVFDQESLELNQSKDFVYITLKEFENTDYRYLALLGQKFTKEDIYLLEKLIDSNIKLDRLFEKGILYSEYGSYRFVLREYWECMYEMISEEERRFYHSLLAKFQTSLDKRAWHLEVSGNKIGAIVTYLRYIRKAIQNYESYSTIKKMLEYVQTQLGGRESYAFLSLSVQFAEVFGDVAFAESIQIPEKRLYDLLSIRKCFAIADFDNLIKLAKSTVRYSDFGEYYKTYMELFATYRKYSRRGINKQSLQQIVSRIKIKNSNQALLVGNVYFLLSLLTTESREKIKLLKESERIFREYRILHKLPYVYNNLAVATFSVPLQVKYFEKAVRVADELGIPTRGFHPKANLLSLKLTCGKLQDFLFELQDLKYKTKILKINDTLGFLLSLESFYYAYNNNGMKAIETINETYGINYNMAMIYKLVIFALLRNFLAMKESINTLNQNNIQKFDEYRPLVEFLKSYGCPGEFEKKGIEFLNSNIYYFREEILSVFGYELAKFAPERVKKELERLEKNNTLNQEFIPLALVYEGWGNFYRAMENNYMADNYYKKAAMIFKDIGMNGAYQRIIDTYKLPVKIIDVSSNTYSQVQEIITALKVIEPTTEVETVLNYFLSKLYNIIPAQVAVIALEDKILEQNFIVDLSTSSQSRDFQVEDSENRLNVAPLMVSLSIRIDNYAKVKLVLEDQSLYFSQDYVDILSNLLGNIEKGLVITLKEVLSIRRALVDPLTKVYTRYFFQEILEFFFSSVADFGGSISVIMCDIDNFKKINDTYGHLTGDQVLKNVARIIRDNIRKTDYVARFGGEEFVILLPDSKAKDATAVAERVRELVSNMNAFPFNVTISLGVAEFDADFKNSLGLIQCADIALYEAKHTGKNKTVIYQKGMTGGLNA